ncbi:MAG: ATP-binding protein [Limnochordia bacterium]|jgi:NAD-dependent dihydropyrimidine dehydrogenase PreA subunit|nr:4Fe-4S binding protein [Bacillota bacterium]
MCENCTQHGEGKAWYLEALEYGEDLLADLDRQRYIQEFFARQARLVGRRDPIHYLRLAPTPLRPIIRSFITRRLAVDHYGQAVTIEEVEQIFSLVHGLVRVPCVCRRITRGFDESCCLGFVFRPDSLGAGDFIDPSYWQAPGGKGAEKMTVKEGLELIHQLNKKGYVHSIWTFKTPFIGGLCNCTPGDCRALVATIDYDVPVLHKGAYIARVVPELCSGCGVCLPRCYFQALQIGSHAVIDGTRCYGCGLCAQVCPRKAITMAPRLPDSTIGHELSFGQI